jgi:hypothetical protein
VNDKDWLEMQGLKDEVERLRYIAEKLYVALDAHYGSGREGVDYFTNMALAAYELEARREQ